MWFSSKSILNVAHHSNNNRNVWHSGTQICWVLFAGISKQTEGPYASALLERKSLFFFTLKLGNLYRFQVWRGTTCHFVEVFYANFSFHRCWSVRTFTFFYTLQGFSSCTFLYVFEICASFEISGSFYFALIYKNKTVATVFTMVVSAARYLVSE